MVPLAPVVRMMTSGTFQPLLRILFKRGVYFMVLRWIRSSPNRSLIYVNSIIVS